MKTFVNPQEKNAPIGEFTYEGCRYSGIPIGLTFSVLSEGLAQFLKEIYPFLEEIDTPTQTVDNENCCRKCGRDCKSKYMRDRHEKVCTVASTGTTMILKPIHIFWNYINLDRTQLTPDQLIPETLTGMPQPPSNYIQIDEKDVTEPMPGTPGTAMIGKHVEKVVTDRDGVDWYGGGLEDDFNNG